MIEEHIGYMQASYDYYISVSEKEQNELYLQFKQIVREEALEKESICLLLNRDFIEADETKKISGGILVEGLGDGLKYCYNKQSDKVMLLGLSANPDYVKIIDVLFSLADEVVYRAFDGLGSLKYKDSERVCAIQMKQVCLPACKNIGELAFSMQRSLKVLTAPLLEEIGERAFNLCSQLNSIQAPNLLLIDEQALEDCYDLQEIHFKKLNEIRARAFANCQRLCVVDVPSVTVVGNHAFSMCIRLQEISFPNMQKLDNDVFEDCTALKSIKVNRVEMCDGYE